MACCAPPWRAPRPKRSWSSTAVLNLADHDMAQPFRLLGGLLQLTNTTGAARLVVDSADALDFGATGLEIDYPPFNLDVAPAMRAGLRDLPRPGHAVRLAHLLHTWRVADNATLALAGTACSARLLTPIDAPAKRSSQAADRWNSRGCCANWGGWLFHRWQ